jgi:putative MFS transporter
MGSAYGFGGIGKIIGPIGLALIVGSSNIVKPDVTIAAIVPCFLYLGAWSALAGFAYAFIGFETKGRSIEELIEALWNAAYNREGKLWRGEQWESGAEYDGACL